MKPLHRTFLGVVGLLMLVAILYPPWLHTFDANGDYGGHVTKPAGNHFLFNPPAPEGSARPFGVKLDFPKLLVELLGIASAAVVVFAISPIFIWLANEFFFGHPHLKQQEENRQN